MALIWSVALTEGAVASPPPPLPPRKLVTRGNTNASLPVAANAAKRRKGGERVNSLWTLFRRCLRVPWHLLFPPPHHDHTCRPLPSTPPRWKAHRPCQVPTGFLRGRVQCRRLPVLGRHRYRRLLPWRTVAARTASVWRELGPPFRFYRAPELVVARATTSRVVSEAHPPIGLLARLLLCRRWDEACRCPCVRRTATTTKSRKNGSRALS